MAQSRRPRARTLSLDVGGIVRDGGRGYRLVWSDYGDGTVNLKFSPIKPDGSTGETTTLYLKREEVRRVQSFLGGPNPRRTTPLL